MFDICGLDWCDEDADWVEFTEVLEEIDAEGDCFGWGCFAAEDNVIIVEELSGLVVVIDNDNGKTYRMVRKN